jgi:hypothetical protein
MHVRTHIPYGFRSAIELLGTDSSASSIPGLLRKAAASSLRTLLGCFFVLLCAQTSNAQTTGSGSIQGVVTDPSGAVIANASVTLLEASTNFTLTTRTSSGGAYAFPNINVGTYSLTVTVPGFETFTSSGNVLEVGSSIAINATMTVGSTSVKVEVHTEGMALQTEDPSFKQTIDATEMTEMPLNNRYMTGLVSLVGGTQSQSPSDSTGSKYPTQSSGFSIAGAQGNAVTWRLDGGDNVDYMGGGNGPLPFPDAIGQFSVETAALGGQGGNEGGGLVNIVTKSGTNTYHGSAFEFIRNNFIDAENFFSTAKDTLHQNQYGGAFGGPVRIPKLFDGRNKLFAFAAFQHTYADSASATSNAYLPTQNNILNGDFSATDPVPGPGVGKNACGQAAVQLYDPITGQALPGNKYNQPGGPTLPQWNASALKLISQLPPIVPALDPNNCGHVSYAIPNIAADNEFITRVDYTINKKNNMYARYFLDSNQIPAFYSPTNILLTTQSGQPEIRWQTITIGENYAIRDNLVNTAHVTGVRRQLTRGFNPATPNASNFGIKDFQVDTSGIWINCSTSGSNHCSTIGGGSNLKAVIDDDTPIDIADDVTWILGKHQLTFGGGFVRNQLNVNNGYEANGDFTVNGTWSGNGNPGDANLDLLAGALSSNGFTQSLPQQNALRGPIPTLYVQDTFHASPHLTITAGIRWEPLYFPHDYFHRGAEFNMAAFVANQHSTVYPNAPAGVFYYGDPGVSANFTKNTPLDFNPNFGVSYDLFGNGKTVIRAGAAYAYDQPNFFTQQRNQQNPPFSALVSPNSAAQLCLSDPWLIGGTGNGCAQTGGTDVDPFPFNPKAFAFPQQAQFIVLTSQYKMPNTMQWTASIQQELPHGWTAQVFYTGNRTQHQLDGIPLDPAVYTPGVWGAGGTGCGPVVTTGPAAAAAGTTGGGQVGSACSVTNANQAAQKALGFKGTINSQARYALVEANSAQGNYFSGGGGGSLVLTNQAMGNYNGVTITVQHRFSSVFSIQTNYTRSKCLNDADPQGDVSGNQFSNPYNQMADYGPCGFNIPNNFNANVILKSQFPIHGIGGYLANGWEFAPLVRLVSGTPFTVSEGVDNQFTAQNGDRPNFVPGVNPYNYTKILSDHSGEVYANQSYLNQAAFTLNPVPGTQGDIGRNSFRGPVYIQDDAQISRIFPIHESLNLDLRLEAFNALNHPSFNGPSSGGPSFSGNFGAITGTSVGGRVFQGAVKVSF